MIRYLKRHDLDVSKYDNCINDAVNSRIYAYSWYLDIVADNWDVLVLNDYEAVMPLPWRSKYFIKYVYPPAWTQQLGVFSKHKIEANLIKEFINSIPKKFKKITIQFNSGNDVGLFKTEKRTNYVLPLNKSYEDIYQNYKKDRKKSLSKSKKFDLIFKDRFDTEKLFKIYNLAFPNLNFDEGEFNKLKELLFHCNKNNFGFQRNIYAVESEVASAFFLKNNNRIYYLFGASTLEGKKSGATTYMINSVIEQFSVSKIIFDFEGSMLNGVAEFYRSFESEKESYVLYQKPFRLF